MILISHRGNLNGPMPNMENDPDYIDIAISKGYDVEIDVWCENNILWLGHDRPNHTVKFSWFSERIEKIWIHCKNIESLEFFSKCIYEFNFFWHQEDTVTLTSKKHIWAYPGKQPIKNSIAVMPEINCDDVDQCLGICSDYIHSYGEK